MAEQIVRRLIDDIDGGEAAETVPFSIDGTLYEIDLSGENAQILRDRLSPYVQHARKAGSKGRRDGRTTSSRERTAVSREHAADIRSWAKSQGIEVNERGRIPATVIEQYRNAH